MHFEKGHYQKQEGHSGLVLSTVLKPLKRLSLKIVAFAAIVDQDQAAQNMQPDLRSTLSAMLELYLKKIASNLLLSLPHCRIKISTRFIVVNPLPHNEDF